MVLSDSDCLDACASTTSTAPPHWSASYPPAQARGRSRDSPAGAAAPYPCTDIAGPGTQLVDRVLEDQFKARRRSVAIPAPTGVRQSAVQPVAVRVQDLE